MISLFILLLLAHALSDFVFQTNFIFKLKVKNIWGVVLHASIFFLCAIILTMPLYEHSSNYVLWLFMVTVSHIIIDKTKLIINRNIIQKEILYFFLDQFFHIAAISTIFVMPFGLNEDIVSNNTLFFVSFSYDLIKDWRLYINVSFIIFLLINASYATQVILYYYDRTVNETIKVLRYNLGEMLYRGVVLCLFISPFPYIAILPIVARYYFDKMRLVYDKRRYIIENGIVILLVVIYYIVKRSFYL